MWCCLITTSKCNHQDSYMFTMGSQTHTLSLNSWNAPSQTTSEPHLSVRHRLDTVAFPCEFSRVGYNWLVYETQPIWKICASQNGFIFPISNRGKNRTCLKPPPRLSLSSYVDVPTSNMGTKYQILRTAPQKHRKATYVKLFPHFSHSHSNEAATWVCKRLATFPTLCLFICPVIPATTRVVPRSSGFRRYLWCWSCCCCLLCLSSKPCLFSIRASLANKLVLCKLRSCLIPS